MAKRKRTLSDSVIEKRIREGRGQGHGKDYKPWITIRDIGSNGFSTRTPSLKTGRIHHFLSELELNYFYFVDWSSKVVDIREQYPLPMNETLKISERLGIKHPVDPETQVLVPLTTDFLIDVMENGKVINYARTAKYTKDLNNNRTAEKFEIERTYWLESGVDWGIVTEKDVPTEFLENIKWVYHSANLLDYPTLNRKLLWEINNLYVEYCLNGIKPLGQICDQIDVRLKLETATCLTACRHLISSKIWEVNMWEPIDAGRPLSLIKSHLSAKTIEVTG